MEPGRAVFVGDHPVNDVLAAKQVGMYGFWKRDPYWGESAEADAIVQHLADIPAVIAKLTGRGRHPH